MTNKDAQTGSRCGGQYGTTGAIAQASTNATTDVAGAEIDAQTYSLVAYGINVATNAVTWSVWGASKSDYSDEVCVQSPASVAAAGNGYYQSAAYWPFYRVKIVDTVGGTHGTATVSGTAK